MSISIVKLKYEMKYGSYLIGESYYASLWYIQVKSGFVF